MRKGFLIVWTWTMAALLLAACGNPRGGDGAMSAKSGVSRAARLEVGDRVELRLPTLEGEEVSPADLHDRIVLLDFWATWCIPCRAQKAVLEEVVPDYPGAGLMVLAVNVGEDAALVREYVADHPLSFPVVLDRDTSFFTSLGLFSLPSLVVLDREGRLVEQVSGVIGGRRLRELLAGAGLEPRT